MRTSALFLLLLIPGALHAQSLTALHHYPTHAYSIFDLYPSPLGGYLATVQVWDSIDVDPGPGAIWLEPMVGLEEGAIVAYDANGAYLWHQQLTSTEKVTIGGLSFTEDGQFYASGMAYGMADVDPGPGVATANCVCNGAGRGWYGKYSATGDLLWRAQVGNGTASTSATVRLIYSPLSHDLFMFGEALSGPTDFDPGAGTAVVPPPPMPGQGITNRIYARLDSSGAFQWHRAWGSNRLNQVTRWDDGVNEYFYLAGASFGSPNPIEQQVDYDPGPGQVTPYRAVYTMQDAFASKFDANGDLVWCQFFFGGNGFGPNHNEEATDVSVDAQGNAIVAGIFMSNYLNTAGGSVLSLVPYSGSGTDALLLKLDGADGSLIWEKQFGSPSDDTDGAVCAIDELDRVYIGSTFVNTAELNSGGTSVQVTANGPMWTRDGFVASFDAAGQYLWSGTYGGSGNDGPARLYSSMNEFCMLGYFTETADLDLGPGVNNVAAQQGNDPFFACYDLSGIAMNVDDAEAHALAPPIYPNPSSSIVHIEPGVGAFEVFDAMGQRMITKRTGKQIDVSDWADGIYFARTSSQVVRFVVQH
jgi:Secretion system C-terminal sorting domain